MCEIVTIDGKIWKGARRAAMLVWRGRGKLWEFCVTVDEKIMDTFLTMWAMFGYINSVKIVLYYSRWSRMNKLKMMKQKAAEIVQHNSIIIDFSNELL